MERSHKKKGRGLPCGGQCGQITRGAGLFLGVYAALLLILVFFADRACSSWTTGELLASGRIRYHDYGTQYMDPEACGYDMSGYEAGTAMRLRFSENGGVSEIVPSKGRSVFREEGGVWVLAVILMIVLLLPCEYLFGLWLRERYCGRCGKALSRRDPGCSGT